MRPTSLLLLTASLAAHAAPGWPDLAEPPDAQGGGENDAAVIVGIETYAALPKVPGASQNAQDWYSYLVKSRGVLPENVALLRNHEGALEKIRKYVVRASGQVKKGGTLWFIFIGHGAPAKTGKDGILVGYDAQQDADLLFARSLPQSELVADLAEGKQSRTLVLLDACFSGKDSSGVELVKGLQPVIALAAKAPQGPVTVMTAGAADQFAGPLPGLARPAFSYLMLGALRGWGDKNSDGALTLDEAVAYSNSALLTVLKDRSQTPELNGMDGAAVIARGTEKGPDLAALVLAAASGAVPLAPVSVSRPRGPSAVLLEEQAGERFRARFITGAGLAVTLAGSGALVLAHGASSRLQAGGLADKQSLTSTATSIDTFNTLGVVGLSVGLAATGVGVVLWLLAPEAPAPARAVAVVPLPGGAAVAFSGVWP